MRIGVLDSGIGGLTVLKRLIDECPNYEYIYFGDTIHMPYGEKPKEEVISYGNKIIKFLESKNIDVIIIACGTLSSNKELLVSKKPIVDIISPLTGKLDEYQNLGIIATPLSIKTNAFKKYIKTKTTLISAPKLVPLIESNDYQNLNSVLPEYLEKAKDCDGLLLGCTHYPIIKDIIKKFYKSDIITMDEFILEELKNMKESKFGLKLYFSSLNKNLKNNVEKILNIPNLNIERKWL